MSSLDTVLRLLRERNLRIAFAESCTGGLLSSTLTAWPGVSDVFMGSVVSYSNEAKMSLLGVSEASLKARGAVSSEVALEMARGVCEQFRVECSIAITGIAGPSGGTPQKPVGTVWFAVHGPGFGETSRQQFAGDRVSIQKQSVEFALGFFAQELLKH